MFSYRRVPRVVEPVHFFSQVSTRQTKHGAQSMMPYLVLLGYFAERDSLGLDETLQGLNVASATKQLPFVLGKPPLVLNGRILRHFVLGLGGPSVDALGKVFWVWLSAWGM